MNKTVENKKQASFSKEKLLTFERYRNRRDLLTAVLKDGGSYTIQQADAAIEEFMKGRVK